MEVEAGLLVRLTSMEVAWHSASTLCLDSRIAIKDVFGERADLRREVLFVDHVKSRKKL